MRRVESLGVGKFQIAQDSDLYRFTSDSVLLARFVRAKKNEVVADFCAGSGIVGLHFFAENENVSSVTFFEMQASLAGLCRENIALNGLEEKMACEHMRVQDIPASYTEKFSLILCNPPYERGGFAKEREEIALCRKELSLTLGELSSCAARCLKFGGRLALIQRADRLAEALYTLHEAGLEPKRVQLVAGKAGIAPYAVLISAVKGGRAGVEVLPTLSNEKETV